MQYTYKTKGTCSQEIHFEIEDGKLKNVQFLSIAPSFCRIFPAPQPDASFFRLLRMSCKCFLGSGHTTYKK